MTDTAIKPEVEAAIESVLDAELYELPATYSEVCRYMRAAIAAYLAASGLAEERVVIDNRHPDCHKAADAFWEYWNENGETHKRGYYESTWGAINAALRLVGVRDAGMTVERYTADA